MKYLKFWILLVILLVTLVIVLITQKENIAESTDYIEKIELQSEIGNVNIPILLQGMKAIGFEEGKEEPIILSKEEMKEGTWYDYIAQEGSTEKGGTSKWANAITEDGSMWVWIPRFAYKINYDENQNNGIIDVIFLSGNTNMSMDGTDVTTLGYKVHPAFKNGRNNNYQNGEWDKEITGIWIAKFEAGFAGQKNTSSENIDIKNSSVKYTSDAINVMGEFEEDVSYMTYPVFMGKTFSYNYVKIGDMYSLSLALNEKGNPYGFDKTVDTHMMKNSEWGAATYLAHSKYGRNGSKVSINNINAFKAVYAAGTITGYAGATVNDQDNMLTRLDSKLEDSYDNKSYAWYTSIGMLGSTTGNLYGIYDMNGACSEYMAGYIESINKEKASVYGKSLLKNEQSTKYCTIYKSATPDEIERNYEINKDIYGDAIFETSTDGNGYSSWFDETSIYTYDDAGFFLRSGGFDRGKNSGLFDFENHSGHPYGSYGFRCILIKK